jgi:hypothetical protein
MVITCSPGTEDITKIWYVLKMILWLAVKNSMSIIFEIRYYRISISFENRYFKGITRVRVQILAEISVRLSGWP